MSLCVEILPDHHKHCDDLFVAAENAVQSGNWTIGTKACRRFRAEMEVHFDAEEGLLFPAFEAATGMTGGPTVMMRMEHRQMRELLEQLTAACNEHDQDAYDGIGETLLMLMQQHNMKEENILYPMCDQALGAGAEQVGKELSMLLGAQHG